MAFTHVGDLGTALSSGNNQASLAITTSASAAAGSLVVLLVADDNNDTVTGNSTAVASVADSTGLNTWNRGKESCNSPGGVVEDGSDVSIWWSQLKATIPNGGTITATFTSTANSDATAMTAKNFSLGPPLTVVVVNGTPGAVATAGSLDVTTTNVSCLRVRAIASESNSSTVLTPTAGGWAIFTQAISGAGTSATEQGIRGEWLISTATSAASSPTGGAGAGDQVSVYVAFSENPLPFNQLDWPVPKGATPSIGLRTWQASFLKLPPFRQNDWPVPKGATASIALRTLTSGVNPPEDVTYLPSQANFLNPWGPGRSVSLYTWLSANTALIPAATVTVDEPAEAAYFNPWGAAYPVSLRTWTNAGIQAAPDTTNVPCQASFLNPWGPTPPNSLYAWVVTPQLVSAASPFYQTDWPVPRGPAYPVSLRTWVYEGTLNTAGPFNQPDWPNPTLRPRLELGTSNQVINIDGVKPINQLDWPNPVLRTRLELGTVYQRTIADGLKPFYQSEWPNPLPRGRVDVTWISQGTTAGLLPPFYQTSWPNPAVRVRLELGWSSQVIPPATTASPFYQTEWPNPNRRVSSELGWLNQVIRIDGVKPILQSDWPNPNVRVRLELGWLSQGTTAGLLPPFYQISWPNPTLRGRLELGWLNTAITSVVALPFYQLDWPNPVLRNRPHVGWYNQVINFDGLKPIVPQVWVNPRGPDYSIALRTWIQGPVPPLVTTYPAEADYFNPWGPTYPVSLRTWTQGPRVAAATQTPCAVTGWAVPWGPAYPVSLRSWPQINGTIRIPVGPKPKVTYDYPNPRGPVYPVALRTWLQSLQRPDATHDTSNLPCIPGVWFNPWGPALRQVAPTYPFRYDPAPVDNSLLPSQASFLNPWGPQFPVDLRTWIQVPESATAAQADYVHRGPLFYRLVPRSYHAALQLRLGTLVQTLTPPNVSDLSALADYLNPWGPAFNVNLMFGSRGRVPSTITPATFPRVASVFFNPPGPRFNINILLGVKGRIPDFPQPDKIPCQANFFNPWGPKHHNNLFGYISGVNPDSFNSDYTARVPLITRITLRSYQAAIEAQLPQNRVIHILGNYPCTPAAYFPPWGPRRSKELLSWIYNWEGQYGPVAPPPKTAFDYPNPRGAEYAITLRTWLLSPFAREDTSLGLGGFPQFDWPVPRGPQFPVDLRTQLNFAQQVIPAGPPPPNTDWPNPRGATPATTLRTWLDATKQQLIGQDSLPPRQVDWPNPRGAQRPVADFVQGLNVALLRTFPNAQLDWPNPRGPQRPVMDWVSGTDIAAVFFIPIRQPDWPVPRGAQRPASEYQWLNGNTINIPPTPLSQTDWPNPRGAQPASILNTWINNTQQQLIGKDALPSRQSEWPVPKGPTPGVSLRTIDHNNTRYYGKDTFFGLAGAPNFNWPNPWGPKPLDIYTMVNGFSLPSAPVPPPDPSIHNLRFLADVGPMTAR